MYHTQRASPCLVGVIGWSQTKYKVIITVVTTRKVVVVAAFSSSVLVAGVTVGACPHPQLITPSHQRYEREQEQLCVFIHNLVKALLWWFWIAIIYTIV